MAFIDWSESLSVGNTTIDHDHKIIIKLINELHQGISSGNDHNTLGQILNILIDYTLYHFSREEKIMEVCKYPRIDNHKMQHDALSQKVVEIAQQFNDDSQNISNDDLLTFLKDWLITHILKQDMSFRPYVENNPDAHKLTQSMETGTAFSEPSGYNDVIPNTIN